MPKQTEQITSLSTEPLTEKVVQIHSTPDSLTKKLNHLFFAGTWLALMSALLIVGITFALSGGYNQNQSHRYSIYSAKPLVLGTTTNIFVGGDPRAAKIDEIFRDFNCPRTNLGSEFVREAERNGIPYWVVAAISFQESSCGKLTPEPDGLESYNWWGWGVWGKNTKMFESPEHGIEVVSKYLGDKFYSKGITNTCTIMKTYTPPSEGSWCAGVNYFGDLIQNYKTPLN